MFEVEASLLAIKSLPLVQEHGALTLDGDS